MLLFFQMLNNPAVQSLCVVHDDRNWEISETSSESQFCNEIQKHKSCHWNLTLK